MGSPLWAAAHQGHADVVRYLLTHGVPPTAPGPRKQPTAEQLAERQAAEYPAVAALFEGARWWASASLKQVQEILSTEEIIHSGFTCDRSGRSPIVGPRYHKCGFEYDICSDEFRRLPLEEQNLYECVEKPPPLLFSDHANCVPLCQSCGRQDLLAFLELQGEAKRLRAKQRLAWALALLSDDACVAGFELDTVRRVSEALSAVPLSRDGTFAVKCLQEEIRTQGVATSIENTIRIERFVKVKQQLQPEGVTALEVLLAAAGFAAEDDMVATTTNATIWRALEKFAQSPAVQNLRGCYRCIERRGVKIRSAPTQESTRKRGPEFGACVLVNFIVDGADRLPYLQLSDGGYCLLRELDGSVLFEKVEDSESAVASGLPSPTARASVHAELLESPGIAIQVAKMLAVSGSIPSGIGLFHWRRFQRFARAWPGRPPQLASRLQLPPELQSDMSLKCWTRLSNLHMYEEQFCACGMTLKDVPFVTEDELEHSGITKLFHRRKFLRHAATLPQTAAVQSSVKAIVALHCPRQSSSQQQDHHLWGNTGADRLFCDHMVEFRRIRQLVDTTEAAEIYRRKRGKFCGRFCAGGPAAEKADARTRWFSRLADTAFDVRAQIEQLWSSELNLTRLQDGVLHRDGKRLIELIFHAEDDVFDEHVTREYHNDEPRNQGGVESAQQFFDKHVVSMRRIRQLADPERAVLLQPRFNQHGVDAERREVRELNLPVWNQIGWPLIKPVERLWAGERDLDVIARGCDDNTRALVQLILSSDGDQDIAAVADQRHREDMERRRAEHRRVLQTPAGAATEGATTEGSESLADKIFRSNLVSHRRIRQLAHPVLAMAQHPRFCPGGVEAEKQDVRRSIIPGLARAGWNVGPAIEQMWAGEYDLQVLSRGLGLNETRFMELILEADQPQYAADAHREHHAQHGARVRGHEARQHEATQRQVAQGGGQVGENCRCTVCSRQYAVCFGTYGWRHGGRWTPSKPAGVDDAEPESPNRQYCSAECEATAARVGQLSTTETTTTTPTDGLKDQMEAVREQGRILVTQAGFSAAQAACAVNYLTDDGPSDRARFEQAVRDDRVSAESLAGGAIEYLIDHPNVGQEPTVETTDSWARRLVCPRGHGLATHATVHQRRYCNRCRSNGPEFHRCQVCDYDLCAACYVALCPPCEEGVPPLPTVVNGGGGGDDGTRTDDDADEVDDTLYDKDDGAPDQEPTATNPVSQNAQVASMDEMRARRIAKFLPRPMPESQGQPEPEPEPESESESKAVVALCLPSLEGFLASCKLTQYVTMLAGRGMEQLMKATEEELQVAGMKRFHAKRFIRHRTGLLAGLEIG
eukprot:COSAG01_NODE_557_length_15478_cov_45.809623_10_plen_1329_part_00